LEADPQNAMYKNSYGLSLQNYAELLAKTGDRAGALARYREALSIFQQLLALNPGTKWRQEECAALLAAIGELTAANGRK
jgi:tetratricopeptide (TPR) repeat protein